MLLVVRQQTWLLSLRRQATLWTRSISTTSRLNEKALPPRRKIEDHEIIESFLKGSGPGGQKINKTSSAVQLKHIPTGIVVKSQATRSRDQNRKYARQILAEKLDEMEHGADSRIAIKAERARTKKASALKKTKRKYKKLDQEKQAEQTHAEQADAVPTNAELSNEVTKANTTLVDDGSSKHSGLE